MTDSFNEAEQSAAERAKFGALVNGAPAGVDPTLDLSAMDNAIAPAIPAAEQAYPTAPENNKSSGRVATMLSNNVRKRLGEGKNSRYLALKADLAYRLNPAQETADMAAEANFRVYDKKGRYADLERQLSGSPIDLLNAHVGVLRREVGKRIQDAVEPARSTVTLSSIREVFDKEERIGAKYDKAIALARLYEATSADSRNIEDLMGAHTSINEARSLSAGQVDWVEGVYNWTLGLLRSEVRRLMQTGTHDAVELAEFRVSHDKDESVGSLYDAAIAYANLAERLPQGQRSKRDLIEAYEFANRAVRLSPEENWVRDVYNWTLGLLRGEVTKRLQEDVRPSKETVELAEYRLANDRDEYIGALHDAAIAYGRLYQTTAKERGQLTTARGHIEKASNLSAGQVDWVENVKQWITSLE